MNKKTKIYLAISFIISIIIVLGVVVFLLQKRSQEFRLNNTGKEIEIQNAPTPGSAKNNFRLLLTSGGITNDRIKTALADLAGKDIKDISVADIITASAPVNDSIYAVAEKESLKQAGLENVSVIDIRDPRENWINTLESADVIWIEGGNTYYLLDWARKSGLDKDLPELLKDKVYVGVSAGSILVGPDINYAGWDIGDKDKNETDLVDFTGLNIVDFGVFPHYKEDQKNDLEKMSKTINYPMYAIDDGCAILVRGGQVKAIGEGVGLIMENRKNKSVKLP